MRKFAASPVHLNGSMVPYSPGGRATGRNLVSRALEAGKTRLLHADLLPFAMAPKCSNDAGETRTMTLGWT
jgi:hypothetical protein